MIFALLTWMLAGNYYPAEFQDWPPLLYWVMGAVTAIMLFVGVLLHEQEPPTMLVTPENNRRNRNHALAFAGMMAVPLAVAG